LSSASFSSRSAAIQSGRQAMALQIAKLRSVIESKYR